jgi:hypothetical protein
MLKTPCEKEGASMVEVIARPLQTKASSAAFSCRKPILKMAHAD